MIIPSSSCRAATSALFVFGFTLLTALSAAHADTPVHLWGFRGRCDRMPDIDKMIEKRLFEQRRDVALLRAPDGKPLPVCVGERCAQALSASCPQVKGRLLGGQAFEGKIVRTRLWLYDLETGQIAYQDDYCHTCNILGALAVHSRRLIEQPQFGAAAPGPTPSYCGAVARTEAAQKRGPIFLTVYGDSRHKTALHSSLRAQLEALGRVAMPVPVESKTYPREVLEQIVAGQQDARVLMVQAQKDGNAAVFVYDQSSRKVDAQEIKCAGCEAESLTLRVKETVSELLERCSGEQCAEAVRIGAVQPPIAACEPFSTDSCASPELDALLAPRGPVILSSGVDPKTAKLLKGLTWGFVAATAATGITLLAANASGAGSYADPNGTPIDNSLWRAGWTATGISIGLLGLAIPVTLILNRAPPGNAANPPPSATATPLIQCP